MNLAVVTASVNLHQIAAYSYENKWHDQPEHRPTLYSAVIHEGKNVNLHLLLLTCEALLGFHTATSPVKGSEKLRNLDQGRNEKD
jgi:hypothetical protein